MCQDGGLGGTVAILDFKKRNVTQMNLEFERGSNNEQYWIKRLNLWWKKEVQDVGCFLWLIPSKYLRKKKRGNGNSALFKNRIRGSPKHMKECCNILYPGIPPLKQAHPAQCILEESKMSLHFLNLHLGFVSLRIWVQPSKHVPKAYVTHKPCWPYAKKRGIRPAVTEMCKTTWGWRETSSCGIRPSVHLAQPPLTALSCETFFCRPAMCPRPLKPWIHPARTKTQSWLHARMQGVVGVLCLCIHFQGKHITPSFGCQTSPIMREQ